IGDGSNGKVNYGIRIASLEFTGVHSGLVQSLYSPSITVDSASNVEFDWVGGIYTLQNVRDIKILAGLGSIQANNATHFLVQDFNGPLTATLLNSTSVVNLAGDYDLSGTNVTLSNVAG